jgi:hypothetical protein
MLAQNIPKSDVDRAQGSHLRSSPSGIIDPIVHQAPELFDTQWVAAEQEERGEEMLDDRSGGLGVDISFT